MLGQLQPIQSFARCLGKDILVPALVVMEWLRYPLQLLKTLWFGFAPFDKTFPLQIWMSVLEMPEGITSFLVYLSIPMHPVNLCRAKDTESRTWLRRSGPLSQNAKARAAQSLKCRNASALRQAALCLFKVSPSLVWFVCVGLHYNIISFCESGRARLFFLSCRWNRCQVQAMISAFIECPRWCLPKPRVSWPCCDKAHGVSAYGRYCKYGCPR